MIDWQRVIWNLRSNTGYAVSTIARKIGSTEKHLNRIARGEVMEPRFNTGVKMLDYHLDVMGEEKHRKVLHE